MSQYLYVRNPNHPLHAAATAEGATLESYVTAGRRSRRTTARCGRSRATSTSAVRRLLGGCSTCRTEHRGAPLRRDHRAVRRVARPAAPHVRMEASVLRGGQRHPGEPEGARARSTRGLIEEMNTLDRRLYEWSGERFSEAIAPRRASTGAPALLPPEPPLPADRECTRAEADQVRWFGPDPEARSRFASIQRGPIAGFEAPPSPTSGL